MLKHMSVTVDTDMLAAENFEGSLPEFAAEKVNAQLGPQMPLCRIVNVEFFCWTTEVRPKENNSDTWYTKICMKLYVWYVM